MAARESLEERRDRLASGPRVRALREHLIELGTRGSIGDDAAYGLAMLIVDATLDGDEASLHVASRELQVMYRRLARDGSGDDVAEDRGRVLALLDVASWGMERALSLSALAELEMDSAAHQFLKAVSEQPGMTNHALAEAIGISDAEASRVGRRLSDVSLAAKRRLGRRNHWEVTPKGIQTLELLENGGVSRYLRPHYQTH